MCQVRREDDHVAETPRCGPWAQHQEAALIRRGGGKLHGDGKDPAILGTRIRGLIHVPIISSVHELGPATSCIWAGGR